MGHFCLMVFVPLHNLGGFAPVLDVTLHQTLHHFESDVRRIRIGGSFG